MANGIEGCRVNFLFFRKNAIRRQPLIESNVAKNFGEICANPGQKYGNAALLRVMEEVFEVLDCHDVRVAGPS